MKGQAGAIDIFLFIVLVMSSGILLLYVSSIFLKTINDQLFVQRVKLIEKQIFLSMISLKKQNNEYSYLYLSKMCQDHSGFYSLKDFFENYTSDVSLWDKINRTIYNGKIIIEVCGYYYPCQGTECNWNSKSMKEKINNMSKKAHKVIVYRVSAFDQKNQEEDGYDTHIYYFS